MADDGRWAADATEAGTTFTTGAGANSGADARQALIVAATAEGSPANSCWRSVWSVVKTLQEITVQLILPYRIADGSSYRILRPCRLDRLQNIQFANPRIKPS